MSTYKEQFLAFRIYRFKDAQAYGQLYDLHADRIRRFMAFKVPRLEDADELTSEAFLRGWEYMTSSAVENPSALLFRIARNLIADFYRRQKETEPLTDVLAATLPGRERDVEEQVTEKLETEKLLEILKELKEEYREVLVMRYLSEMNVGEIASTLEKSPNSIRVLLHRAKKALQEKVEGRT